MNGKNINICKGKRILVAPLDWGLGHYTRCIPIIKELIQEGAAVFIAAEAQGVVIFEKEFPGISIIPLKGYRVRYNKTKQLFSLNILLQVPKLRRAIRSENKWLKQVIDENKIELVISDNRYGLYDDKIPCIFITHQLQILTGNKLLNKWLQKINYSFIEKFTECWIPDIESECGVAGVLSHPLQFPKIPVTYIGLLSRFSKTSVPQKYDLLVMLSGPEPQRTILEKLLLQQVKNTKLQILLVRGLPGDLTDISPAYPTVKILSHLPAGDLNEAILESGLVIARAGYSTIMDLLVLEKKAILIPTPGQKEQEYLATYLSEKKWFYSCDQEKINLARAMQLAFDPPVYSFKNPSQLKVNIERLISAFKDKQAYL